METILIVDDEKNTCKMLSQGTQDARVSSLDGYEW